MSDTAIVAIVAILVTPLMNGLLSWLKHRWEQEAARTAGRQERDRDVEEALATVDQLVHASSVMLSLEGVHGGIEFRQVVERADTAIEQVTRAHARHPSSTVREHLRALLAPLSGMQASLASIQLDQKRLDGESLAGWPQYERATELNQQVARASEYAANALHTWQEGGSS